MCVCVCVCVCDVCVCICVCVYVCVCLVIVIIYCWLSYIFTACCYNVFHAFAILRRLKYLNIHLRLYTVPAGRSRGVNYQAVFP